MEAGSGFGRRLRECRLGAGLTQEELAERSGLSARAIADMERGRTRRPYRRSVQVLADALGLEESQRELLVRASRPDSEAGGVPGAAATVPVARQLPPKVSCFAGRAEELAVLTELLEGCRGAGGAVVISAIAGTAGVGKTGLATHWAHQVAPLFPDGQLYVNLRGYDPGLPVAPADALAGFLRALLALARPGVPLADLAAELADQQRQLDLLDAGGDRATAVQAVFSWSDQQLDPADARAFWLLGLHPGPDFDAYAMAALAATGLREARQRLSRLTRAHLVQPAAPGRYGMHDLLRRYAADRAEALGDRDEARERILDFLQGTALRAEALCQREARSAAITRRQPAARVAPQLADSDQAQAWLRAERPTLLACLDQAAAEGRRARVIALTAGLAYLLRADGPWAEARARHAAAVRAAQELGDRLAEAHALLCLGSVGGPTGDGGSDGDRSCRDIRSTG